MKSHEYTPVLFQRDIELLARKIEMLGKQYRFVYGVPRGGVPLATALALRLNLEMVDNPYSDPCCLVVDDVVDSGATRKKYYEYDFASLHIKQSTPKELYPIAYVSVYSDWIDYFWERGEVNKMECDIEKGVSHIFKGLEEELGLDLKNPNFTETPKRVAKAYREIFSGVKDTDAQIDNILSKAFPSEGYRSIILSPGITTFSMCPHHLLPVEYRMSIGYIPSKEGKVLGASKISRLAEVLSRRPVLQEALTEDIVHALERIKPEGVAVVVTGVHYCMRMRGIKSTGTFETSAMSGVFMEDQKTRMEFFELLKINHSIFK
jgi:GTP cyclohydrolase I